MRFSKNQEFTKFAFLLDTMSLAQVSSQKTIWTTFLIAPMDTLGEQFGQNLIPKP